MSDDDYRIEITMDGGILVRWQYPGDPHERARRVAAALSTTAGEQGEPDGWLVEWIPPSRRRQRFNAFLTIGEANEEANELRGRGYKAFVIPMDRRAPRETT